MAQGQMAEPARVRHRRLERPGDATEALSFLAEIAQVQGDSKTLEALQREREAEESAPQSPAEVVQRLSHQVRLWRQRMVRVRRTEVQLAGH